MFENRRILVTGGTGSWGYELVTQLLRYRPAEIVVFSRNESAQVAMSRIFDNPRLKFCIGDIRDREALLKACQSIDLVFHLAALKHVPVCEEQPYEALKTNVIGTQNVIEAAIDNKVERVIHISTDKAANPSNFYGMTKAIGEKLIVYANLLRSQTKFVCVRGGNVLGTNGSVIHLFLDQIRNNNRVNLTDRNMTRFFMTLEEAVRLLFQATDQSVGGEIFVMTMPSCRIVDLAEVLMDALGKQVEIVETGVRPGEKIHEILLTEFEAATTVEYDDQYLVILPALAIPGLKPRYAPYEPVRYSSYSSSDSLMNKDEIRAMLERGGFIS